MDERSTHPTESVPELFVRHSADIRGFLLAFTPDFHQVDDLLHRVFLCATRKADEFRPGTNFVAWARAIARYELLEAARESRRGPACLSPETIDSLAAAAPSALESEPERLTALVECLEQLAPQANRAITLRYLEMLSPSKIAERLSLTVGSVHTTLWRARQALRECIERKTGAEGA